MARGDASSTVAAMLALQTPPVIVGLGGYGLAFGVFCSENANLTTEDAALTQARSVLPGFPDGVLRVQPKQGRLFTECPVWNVGNADAAAKAPTVSDVPVLIMEGDFDAATAPAWVNLITPHLKNSQLVYLGGSHSFSVDRYMARRAVELWPELPVIMRANRAFLRRAVRYLLAQGVTQFVDLGSGIPTVGNVHEIVQAASARARVVYVDSDPVAVAHSRAILGGDQRTAVVLADLCDVDAVWRDRALTELIDPVRPVGVLMVAVLHFVPDSADSPAVIKRYRAAMASGSFLAISHATFEGQPDQAGPHAALYRQTPTPMTMRSRAEIAALLDGFDLVPPGLVYLPQWRPLSGEASVAAPQRFSGLAAVGRRDEHG